MSLEGFVRASGALMGVARESFGAGGPLGAVGLAPVPPRGPRLASGRAADGFDAESHVVASDVSALGDQDVFADAQLADAVTAASAGRVRMDAVIAAALADVAALGVSTNTPQGQRALVDAIKRRLQETSQTLHEGDADAGTRAAASEATAAGYSATAANPGTAPTVPASAPMAGAPMMSGMPMGAPMSPGMGAVPLASLGGLAAPLASLSGLAAQTATAGPATTPARLLSSAVDATSIPGLPDLSAPGRAAEAGLQKYTKLVNRAVSAAFPEITDIGGVRPDTLKWHPQGLALDIMIPNPDSAQGRALGSRILNFLIRHHGALGIDHMMYRQRQYDPDGASSPMEDRGSPTQNHMDHIHVATIGGGY